MSKDLKIDLCHVHRGWGWERAGSRRALNIKRSIELELNVMPVYCDWIFNRF